VVKRKSIEEGNNTKEKKKKKFGARKRLEGLGQKFVGIVRGGSAAGRRRPKQKGRNQPPQRLTLIKRVWRRLGVRGGRSAVVPLSLWSGKKNTESH